MKCQFVRDNQDTCQAYAMKDSVFCYLHNPDVSNEDKKLTQIRGGKGNIVKLEEALPEIKVAKTKDIVVLLEDTLNRVRSGQLDIRIANTIGYLCGHLIKALEVADIDERIISIERIIFERSKKY